MPSGWLFIIAGAVLIAIGGLLTYYGQDLLSRRDPAMPVISPQHEKVLTLIHKYQVQLGAKKLIILRNGKLYEDQGEIPNIDLAGEAPGASSDPAERQREFESIMDTMPPEYLRMIPEMRLGSPFVVAITDAGIRYLKTR